MSGDPESNPLATALLWAIVAAAIVLWRRIDVWLDRWHANRSIAGRFVVRSPRHDFGACCDPSLPASCPPGCHVEHAPAAGGACRAVHVPGCSRSHDPFPVDVVREAEHAARVIRAGRGH